MPLVAKTIRAWSCGTKTMVLWPKGLALAASSTSGTCQPSIVSRLTLYSVSGNTPWSIAVCGLLHQPTPYWVSPETLYPFGRYPISFSRFVHRRKSPLCLLRKKVSRKTLRTLRIISTPVSSKKVSREKNYGASGISAEGS